VDPVGKNALQARSAITRSARYQLPCKGLFWTITIFL
jgi:hypothetical protein